ncbi:hypothetical protein Xekk_02176 [Xenorhabdus sp. KK7.4]|nr:hypothetical protein Xekk_02176 [Xenorhabdus sp. KK7.4]
MICVLFYKLVRIYNGDIKNNIYILVETDYLNIILWFSKIFFISVTAGNLIYARWDTIYVLILIR